MTAENQTSHSLTSVLGKTMRKFPLETNSKYMKDKKVTRKSQHRFRMDIHCLTNSTAFVMTGCGDKGRAVDVVQLDQVAFHVVFHSILEAIVGKYEGSR